MASNSRTFISFLISVIFMLLIFTVAWFTLGKIEKQTRDTSKDALQTVLITTQEALHLWITQRKFDVLDIAQYGELQQLTNTLLSREKNLKNNQTLHSIRSLITPRLSRYGDRDFTIISPDRVNIASMRDEIIGKTNIIQQQRKEYLDSVFSGATVFIPTIRPEQPKTEVAIAETRNEPEIFIAAPLKSLEGKIIAVIAIKINLKRDFTRITQLSRIGQTGETYAFDEQGTLISESRFDDQLRRIGLVGTNSRGIGSIRIADPGGNLLEGYMPTVEANQLPLTLMASRATKGQSGYDTDGYRDYRGVEVFGAWIWDKELGFGLTTEVDVNEAMQPFYSTRQAIILIAVLSVLLCGILLAIYTSSKD